MNSKVTDTIKNDLSEQLKTYKELPFNLTLNAIAEHYNVSLTPIREVVEELIADQLILRKPNGRLERLVKPSGRKKVPKARVSEAVDMFESDLDQRVLSEVIQLSLSDDEVFLREEATAQKFDTGRTVMRQVFSRLAGVGALVHVPRRGWKVKTFREKDMLDYLEIREILEVKALKLARTTFDSEELKSFLKTNVADRDARKAKLNNDLHSYWIDRCDNRYIQDFFERHSGFYSSLFDYAALGKDIKSSMAQEHRDILNALIENDWREAEKALVKHIRSQKKNVQQLVQMKKASH